MLHNKNLPKNPGEEFKDIEGKINSAATSKDAADIIAKYREEMMTVLKTNEAEGSEDESKLNGLKMKLEAKKFSLETGLGTMGSLNLTDNNDIINFWKGVVDGSSLTGATADATQKDDLNNTIIELLKKIQFLHDNGKGNQIKDFTLFKGKSTDITNFKETLKNPLIKDLLNQTDPAEVKNDIDSFINSMKHPSGNAFYIRIADKLFNDEQGKVAMRIALYFYCLKKLIEEDKLTEDIYNDAKNILENQIKNEEIPKIKGLHNVKKELGYISPEHETLRDLNVKAGDINLGSKDITAGFTEIQDLTSKFENGVATGIEKYEIDKDLIKVTDADGNSLDVSLSEPSGRDLAKLFSNINDGEKSADIHINIGGAKIKIGRLILDNTAGAAKLHIKLDDFTTISGLAASAGITLPNFPFNFDIPVKGIKDVKNGLSGCKASLTNDCILSLTNTTPPPPTTTTPPPPTTTTPPPPTTTTPPPPTTTTPPPDLEINAVVSDMGENVLKEKVAQDVEEELRQEYKDIVSGNVFKRARFFFARGSMRKKRIKKRMESMSGQAFTGDAIIDDQTGNAADRHQLEMKKGLNGDIKNIDTTTPVVYQNPQINNLCKRYLSGSVNDNQFQTEFNTILESDTALKNELDKANIKHMGTNILIRMKQKLAWKTLVDVVNTNITGYTSTGASSHFDNINTAIQNYIKTYQDNASGLLSVYNDYLNNPADPVKLKDLEDYLAHEKAVMSLSANNIRIKLDIIKGGDSAYQINNKKREKNLWYRLGNKMDKHPWLTNGFNIGASIGLGLATGGLGAVAAARTTTGAFAGMVGIENSIKKWTHHTKEQSTHEKELVSNYDEEMEKVKDWEKTKKDNGWRTRKHYKADRQLELYHETTQSNIKITNVISQDILDISSKIGALNSDDENLLKCNLIEGWARLKYYREVGHNFLASKDKTKTEEDLNKLEKAIFIGIDRLGSTSTSDIESYSATNSLGRSITFDDIYDAIKKDFKETDKAFRRRRRHLAEKYGVCTALLSAGTALGFQKLMGTGVFAKGTGPTAGYSSKTNLTDDFGLGKHQLLDGGTENNIYNGTKSALTGVPDGSNLNISYGAGTDATGFLPGQTPTAGDLAVKVKDVSKNIEAMGGLTRADKDIFIKEVAGLGGGSGTNGVLQNMRQAEFLEQAARGLSDSGMSGKVTVSLMHDAAKLDVVGTHIKDVSERVVNGVVKVTKDSVPGQAPETWGKWILGAPLFFNTFKDKND